MRIKKTPTGALLVIAAILTGCSQAPQSSQTVYTNATDTEKSLSTTLTKFFLETSDAQTVRDKISTAFSCTLEQAPAESVAKYGEHAGDLCKSKEIVIIVNQYKHDTAAESKAYAATAAEKLSEAGDYLWIYAGDSGIMLPRNTLDKLDTAKIASKLSG